MSDDLWKRLLRSWVEYQGSRKRGVPPQFGNQIITPPTSFTTGKFGADYLYVYPDCAAVLTAPHGQRILIERGGYADLPAGVYSLHYVDQRKHLTSLPVVTARSADGPQVGLAINLNWQVKDPLAVMSIDQPINVLLASATTILKSFIQSHKHDELAQGQDRLRVDDAVIQRYVTHEIGQIQACRGFAILDVQVTSRQGDPALLEIQQARQVQEKKTSAEKDKLQQEKELVDQREQLLRRQGEANKIQAEQEAELAKLRDEFAVQRAELHYQMDVLQAEIERLRKLPDHQHEEAMASIQARAKALETMLQGLAAKGFMLNGDEARVIDSITRSMSDSSAASSTPLTLLSASLNQLMPPPSKK